MKKAYDRFASSLRSSPHNLMSPTALEELEARHLPEARAFAELIRQGSGSNVIVDIGSGGGIPGIPLAIELPQHQVHLVESRRKKAEFLDRVVRDFELTAIVHQRRIEEVIPELDLTAEAIITARAVAPLHRLVTWTEPALRRGATLYAIKGDRFHVELDEAQTLLGRARLVASVAEPDHERSMPRVVIVQRA